MVCRHGPNDTSCSSHPRYVAPYVAPPKTPDSKNYEILDVEVVGPHLVLRVLYPNCSLCAYEGKKCLVFLNTSTADALRWKEIDPHFRAPAQYPPRQKTQAPSPSARFPASQEGWLDAVAYAQAKSPRSPNVPLQPPF